ncbi:MAG: hypothetical protein ABEI80_07120 [Haloplanus sp.]
MRVLPAFAAALLLCVATVGAAGGLGDPAPARPTPDHDASPRAIDAGPPVAQTDANGTPLQQISVLDVPPESVRRSSVEEQHVDLGPAVSLSANVTTYRLRTLAVVERVQAAGTTDMRRARIETALRTLETRVDALERRQRAAVAAYSRGESSAKELLVELVRISIAAQELDDRRTRIEQLAADTPEYDIDRGRLASIGNRLSAFTGPVRAHARAVLRGEAEPHRFYLATSSQSVTVTTIVDGAYLRESYRSDLQNGDGDQIELEVALDIVAAGYPVIWNTTREQTQVFGGGQTYPVRIAHSRGDLTAFVDSDARVVYAEHQRRPLETIVADHRVQRSSDGLRLIVNHTYPGGPTQIRVIDDVTGEPVDAAVSMTVGAGDPTRIGTTGDGGVLWTLSPNRRFTVTVDAGDSTVSAVVSPGTPPLVGTRNMSSDSGNTTATPTANGTTAADIYYE